MKNSIKKYSEKMSRIYAIFKSSMHLLIVFAFFSMMSLITIKVGEYSRVEPTRAEIDSKLNNGSSKKLDQESLDKLKELQERNISIDSLFDNGRTNPFEN